MRPRNEDILFGNGLHKSKSKLLIEAERMWGYATNFDARPLRQQSMAILGGRLSSSVNHAITIITIMTLWVWIMMLQMLMGADDEDADANKSDDESQR